jgi:hypothetical protein
MHDCKFSMELFIAKKWMTSPFFLVAVVFPEVPGRESNLNFRKCCRFANKNFQGQ